LARGLAAVHGSARAERFDAATFRPRYPCVMFIIILLLRKRGKNARGMPIAEVYRRLSQMRILIRANLLRAARPASSAYFDVFSFSFYELSCENLSLARDYLACRSSTQLST
jgi:hypothetical protein